MRAGDVWAVPVTVRPEPRRRNPLVRLLGLAVPVLFVGSLFTISAVTARNSGGTPDSGLALRAAADVNTNNSSFTYVPGQTGTSMSSRQFAKGAPGVLTLSVYGMPPAPGDTSATIYANLSNGTTQVAHFVAGPTVAVTVLRNGAPFRVLTLTNPGLSSLDAGQALDLQAALPLDGGATYKLSAALVGVGTNPAFTLATS